MKRFNRQFSDFAFYWASNGKLAYAIVWSGICIGVGRGGGGGMGRTPNNFRGGANIPFAPLPSPPQ